MSIGNIDIGVVLNDKESLVILYLLVHWSIDDRGFLIMEHYANWQWDHAILVNAMVDLPKASIATQSCHDDHAAIWRKRCNLILRPWGYI
jgi:hypothetical protein